MKKQDARAALAEARRRLVALTNLAGGEPIAEAFSDFYDVVETLLPPEQETAQPQPMEYEALAFALCRVEREHHGLPPMSLTEFRASQSLTVRLLAVARAAVQTIIPEKACWVFGEVLNDDELNALRSRAIRGISG